MTANPLDDAVSRQYERWVYPEPIADLPAWTCWPGATDDDLRRYARELFQSLWQQDFLQVAPRAG
jgi:hypothetical protein